MNWDDAECFEDEWCPLCDEPAVVCDCGMDECDESAEEEVLP